MYKNYNKETEIKTDRYFITYADMITLLLGLFVILYASSKVDQEKYREFSKAFSEAFQKGDGVLEGSTGVLEGSSQAVDNAMELLRAKSLDEIFNESSVSLKSFVEHGQLDIKRIDGAIIITLPEKLMFESGKAEVLQAGQTVMDTLGLILRGIKYQVTVDGHTDSNPIKTFQYESNWHLSVARALNVGYSLVEEGLPQSSLIIRGFGSQRPTGDNNDSEGRAKNRRVEVKISNLRDSAPSTKGYSEPVIE